MTAPAFQAGVSSRPVALITGVGRTVNIGAGIARRLASDGWDLALNYWAQYDTRMPWGIQPRDIDILSKELKELGARVLFIEADLERRESPREIFQAAKPLGPISALVLSHCEGVNSTILNTTEESFDRHFAVNVRASWQLIREFALQVPETGGYIVALTSDHTTGNLPYGSSKGALDRIVIAAANELADRKISSNALSPGPIDTGWMDEETRKYCLERQPSGRLGTPADIGNFVSFLLSPAGAWVNGQLLKCDGGFSTIY